MPVLVRNTEPGVTVFSDLVAKIQIEWQAKGDPSGLDLQPVPDALLENVDFIRALNKGVLVVVEASDAAQKQIEEQTVFWRAQRQAADEAAQASITREADNDLVSVPCVGPNARGQGECADLVLVRSRTRDEHPPLCPRHQQLAPQYVRTEGEFDNERGKPEVLWTRTTVGAREREQV